MSMEFVDCNCMLGKWKKNVGKCFYESRDLIAAMDKAGIAKSLVFGSFARYSEIRTGNNMLAEKIKGNDRLIPCAVAIPHHSGEFTPPEEFCRFLRDNNIKAVRVFPSFHGVSLYTWLWEDLFSELEKRRIPVFIDLTVQHWSEEVNWDQIYNLCRTYSKLPIVMIRMGVKADRYIYYLLDKCGNLYMETSYYLVNNGIEKIVKSFGAKRLIFGTGMPVYSPNPPVAMVALSDIEPNDKEMIASRNLLDLLNGVDINGK